MHSEYTVNVSSEGERGETDGDWCSIRQAPQAQVKLRTVGEVPPGRDTWRRRMPACTDCGAVVLLRGSEPRAGPSKWRPRPLARLAPDSLKTSLI